ncbi:MAG TPA: EAL domain-containing protein [Euzebyales bacterium]|nr:EAL domain-containing protein [Euzebyales bacterium]
MADSLLHQHQTALAITRLHTAIVSLSAIENAAEAGETDITPQMLTAATNRLLASLDRATDRLPRNEAEAVRTDVLAYRDSVDLTVSGFLTASDEGADFDDRVTEPLFASLESRLDRLAIEAEMAAQRTASTTRRGLLLVLGMTIAGVTGFAIVGARLEQRAGARHESARLKDRFRAIVENLEEFVLVVDRDGALQYVSPSLEAGMRPGEDATSLDELLVGLAPESRAEFDRLMTAPETGPVQVEVHEPDGHVRYFEVLASDQGDNPNVAGMVVTAREITDRVLLEQRLRHQATTDELTGLPNRRALNDASERAVARTRRSGSRVGLVLVDLDGFKGINDAMGHPVGDDLLVQVAHRLESACRGEELLVRLGGDEFAVLLEGLSGEADAVTMARRLREALEDPYELGGHLIAAHASFGVAVMDDAHSFDDLFRHADVALYEAKERGRNQLVVYEPGMDYLMQTDVRLRREMASGFSSGEFSLAYQPLLDVQTSRPIGLEALMRWNSSSLGPVSPAAFIPVAERSGMIIELGLWALRTACSQLVAWQREQLTDDLTMSVNVSIAQLQQASFVDQLTRVIEETEITPSDLILEITESVLAQQPTAVAAALERIRALGVKVALDDFGSGYSSMSQLQRLPVDEIKIDKEFIQAISEGDTGSQSMVNTLFALGRSMGLRTVAEGVEHLDQFEALVAQHCDVAQGYLFARPMPPSDTLEFLRTFNLPVRHTTGVDEPVPGSGD